MLEPILSKYTINQIKNLLIGNICRLRSLSILVNVIYDSYNDLPLIECYMIVRNYR